MARQRFDTQVIHRPLSRPRSRPPVTDETPRPTVKQSRGSKTVKVHRGLKYTKAWASNKKIVYRCSGYRRTKCKATLELQTPSFEYHLVNDHTCQGGHLSQATLLDVTKSMKKASDHLATSDLSLSVGDVWAQISAQFYPADSDIIAEGLTESQVTNRVHRIRRRYYGGDLHGVVEVRPLSLVQGTTMPFFQFHVVTANANPTKPAHRIVGWAHPVLKEVLKYHGSTLFIDGTFRCVPRGFQQCVILMVDDRARDLFIPVYYALCTSRTEEACWEIIDQIYKDTEEKMQPAEIVCDFEAGLINAARGHFPNAEVIGCFFHFKQALRRRMKELRLSDQAAGIAMERVYWIC